jgi:hypothetical protein
LGSLSNLHLVIRSIGERTAGVAKRLAVETLPEESITVVEETPFEEALRATYQAGIAAGRKWTMTLDADVLLRPGAISDLQAEAERMPPHYVQVEGRVFDKITGECRQAGHRVYRTALLALAMQRIPEIGSQIRPEDFTLKCLSADGHPSRLAPIVMGLHDFEQYYRDLYRKSVVHATKHRDRLVRIITRCVERRGSDPDYEIILRGIWDGLTASNPATIDARRYMGQAERVMESLGLCEKTTLDAFPQETETVLQAFQRLSEGQFAVHAGAFQRAVNGSRKPALLEKAAHRIERHGWFKGGIACLGAVLKRVGSRLDA